MAQRLPLIVILGATACGKSKLAIELARRFGGEIISADSMQVYRGLDIVTNKVTEEEQSQARHHMINFLDPLQRFSVVDFRDQSISIIDDLMQHQKIPILVGGTNYYIESVLWKNFLLGSKDETISELKKVSNNDESSGTLIDDEYKILKDTPERARHSEEDLQSVERFFNKPIFNDGFKDIESEKLWAILEKVDHKSAHLYHTNDKRRIIRCLQIIQRRQSNYSQILQDQNVSGQTGEASLGGPLRYPETCVFWLNCDNDILDKVLDERVDQMLERGLLAELERFHQDFNKQRQMSNEKADYEKGIFQTIGFKEFHEFLVLEDKHDDDMANKLLKKSIEDMKLSTRRYARKQQKWIRRRFLQSGLRDLPSLYKLDVVFDDKLWTQQVQEPAAKIVEHIINNRIMDPELLHLRQSPIRREESFTAGKLNCDVCNRLFIGSHSINIHLNSRSHKKNLIAANKVRNKSNVPN